MCEISLRFLTDHHVEALILDKDGTLISSRGGIVSKSVVEWIISMKEGGIKMIIASNSLRTQSIKNVSEQLGIDYVLCGIAFLQGKPQTGCLKKALEMLDVTDKETAVVGNQFWTDIWAGNRYGMITIQVKSPP